MIYNQYDLFQIWRCAPIAKGVGFAMIVLSLIVSIYYNVIMAYSIIYIGASFVGTYDKLPWTYCGKALINERCSLQILCNAKKVHRKITRQVEGNKRSNNIQGSAPGCANAAGKAGQKQGRSDQQEQ